MTKKTDKQTRRKAKTASKAASENAQLDRRSFMRLAGLGAGVAGASIGLGASEASASEQAPAAQGGYRETDHVKTYYRMASF
ncbi:MAG: twin-arginine translocation signal domain-containing protein [Pseudolabrys sp.]